MDDYSEVKQILSDERLDIKVTELLMELGVHADLLGYRYLRAAIMIVGTCPEAIRYPTKSLYPQIAKYFAADISAVERNCRRAIDSAYSSKRNGWIVGFFKECGISRKPTCKEFISAVADFIRKEY